MNTPTAYACNDELFPRFHDLQRDFARRLAAHPPVIRAWLAAQPRRDSEGRERGGASRSWRTARLSVGRQRELADLTAPATPTPEETDRLGDWLLSAVPVRTFLEIAEFAKPNLRAVDAAADECGRELVRQREQLFLANYGLAKSAALQRHRCDSGDLLSAASCGLLDAIDRYVPDARAARFAYFASYWIRYHLGRQIQKYGSVVSFPVNQHRIGHRIDRYRAGREAGGLPPPSDLEVRQELKLGPDACYWHSLKPRMVSLESPVNYRDDAPMLEHFLCDPAPDPASALEEAETARFVATVLRDAAPPSTRLMLAYSRSVGSLADAAEDYLQHLHELALERVRPRSQSFSGRRNCL